MCVFVFGGAFLGIALAHGQSVAITTWYEQTLVRLQAHHCSTTALDRAFVQHNLDSMRLAGGAMAFVALGAVVSIVRTRLRPRYL
jgi:hypothetical protein